MGLEKIMAKVGEKLGMKASQNTHKPGNLPDVKDIQASLARFKKPIEKKAEKEAEKAGDVLKRMLGKGKGMSGIAKSVPSGDTRNPLPEAKEKESPKHEEAEKSSPVEKIEEKVKNAKKAPPVPPAKGAAGIMDKVMKAKGK